jgi:hypothetical protein
VEGFFETSETFHASSIIDLQSQRKVADYPLRQGIQLRPVLVVYPDGRSARTARFEFSLKENGATVSTESVGVDTNQRPSADIPNPTRG